MKSRFLTLCLCSLLPLGAQEWSAERIKSNALKIDRIVAENFKSVGIKVPDVADDSTFVRRAFLVSTGRIPTPAEALQFLELESENKRELLIEYLYESDGYNSHTTNWLMDLLRLKDGDANRQMSFAPLIHWVRNAAETNLHWDEFTEKLLSSRGNAWTDSGAAGYFSRDAGMLEDNLANTMRVFLGTRMECAQCHDDPFQEWERMDFYHLAAFVSGDQQTVNRKKNLALQNRPEFLKMAAKSPFNNKGGISMNLYFFSDRLYSHVEFGVPKSKGKGRIRLPKDYQYSDGDPGEYIGAKTPFAGRAKSSSKKDKGDGLEKFAQWVTAEDNERFSQTIALNLWERVMGISLTENPGDYVEPERTNFKKLITELTNMIAQYGYDMKAFQKTLMHTKTFQFVSSNKHLLNGAKNCLDGRNLKRMTAEQMWDSLLSLGTAHPDKLPKRQEPTGLFVADRYYVGEIDEVVPMISKMSNEEYKDYITKIYVEISEGRGPKPSASSIRPEKITGLARASELSSPAPSGHLLDVFGQSDRIEIDGATLEGTVSQALEMLNGKVQEIIVDNEEASLNKAINSISDVEQKIRTIFLVTLNRVPDAEEFQMCLEEVSQTGDRAYRNIISALICSQEFFFVF